MTNLMEQIDEALTKLYDFEYIDIEKFYNHKENGELLDVLSSATFRGYAKEEEMEMLQELYDNLDSFLKFESNHCYGLSDFLV